MRDLPPPYVPGDDEGDVSPDEGDAPPDGGGAPPGEDVEPAAAPGREGQPQPSAGGPGPEREGGRGVPAGRHGGGGAPGTAADARAAGREADRRLAEEVGRMVRDVPDFPTPGILFRDVTPVFADPDLFRRVTRRLAREARRRGAERIAGIESRGFLLGTPVALMLDVPFVTVRKEGKLPGETRTVSYDLEYGSGHLEVQKGAIAAGDRVVVVDDLLATGGTAAGAAELLEGLDGIVAGMCFLIELAALSGRERLGRYNTFSLLEL